MDQAKFHSIVVHSSGAGPIEMTGHRDTDRQDWELRVIFGTRPELPGDTELAQQYSREPKDAITD